MPVHTHTPHNNTVKAGIQSVGHTRRSKPWSEVVEECGCRAIGLQILGPFGEITMNNSSVHRRILTPTEVEAWLGFKWVPDVELKGKGFAHPHPPVSESVYVIATLGSCAPHLTTLIFR